MENTRLAHVRRKSSILESSEAPLSPVMSSPLTNRHVRSGSAAGPGMSVRKAQTKAAAQRLAAVMAHQTGDEDDSEDDLSFDYSGGGTGSVGLTGVKFVPSGAPVNRPTHPKHPHMKTPLPIDEDNEDNDLSVDYTSGRQSIGLAGGRAIRPQCPVVTKAAPQRHQQMNFQQTSTEENKDDDDDDEFSVDYAIGRPSIGLGGGRATRPQSSMSKIHPQGRLQTVVQQPGDEENEDDDILDDYSSGIPVVGLAGGRTARTRSPVTKITPMRNRQMITEQPADEDNDDDNYKSYNYTSGRPSIGLAGGRSMRSHTPLSVRTKEEPPQSGLPTSVSLPSVSQEYIEQPSSALSSPARHASQITNQAEQPPSARSIGSKRSSQSLGSMDQLTSARSPFSGRPVKTVPFMPSTVPISLKPVTPVLQTETPTSLRKDKRFSLDFGSSSSLREELGNQQSASALQDEVDMLQEENESLLEKLRLAEERFEEAEARAKQLEKQVEILGEGVTLDARLLSRKEAALQQREAALKVAAQTHGGQSGNISALQTDAELARDEATSALEQLHEVESELKSIKIMTKRLLLTQEEMEEVVLKRCWLSWYWSLCVRHGIQPDIAGAKHEYWSSFAPLPLEIVLSTGQRAQEGFSSRGNTDDEREKSLQNLHEISGEGNIESMLLVEKGLREMASLKVQDAVAFAMAQQRRRASLKISNTDDVKLPADGQCEAFGLSEEEMEDVRFKQAWLAYFWRRAKNHEIEPDIADERLQYWIFHSSRSSSSQDAVDVERGLVELRKLNIESQLWQKSRKGLDHESNPSSHLEHSF
ncbi:PREDICTED: coiled-coil domain-containing protein SCD2-like isoform X2 [Tarenaya hassleriana]|uniref:coiled-coil domain-containing protein SCD2-like isoform X2 n=1 Tax=Tarenaya hassleriana TaxID=28532 RepID=UPI00053C7022|nr:PREDICTED: coiled-coil domain-containing protein SCD2-like isoform X2 [Tarenaya hassleriana]